MKAPTHWFNHYGPLAALSEVTTLAGFGWSWICAAYHKTTAFQTALLLLFSLVYFFLRMCASMHWYRTEDRGTGIELHCRRALIASCYTLAISLTFFAATQHIFPLLAAVPILAFFTTATLFVIRFHLHDGDTTPPNFYSSGDFLNTEHGRSIKTGHPKSPHGKE
ncbi:MAG: hypothetical protein HY465_02650 [Deltaproteobacteria bacterium]|nr:hypothetical protein [Deltaproteobacteria bacterium]